MFDSQLRPYKATLLAPVASSLSLPPSWVTLAGLLLGLGAALAASQGLWLFAFSLFIANRLLDGLDGEMARLSDGSSDAGGYTDITADTVVYAAVPLGVAVGTDIGHIWPLTALLLASFYVNTITWTYLAALIEKRQSSTQRPTSVVMPRGLVEGGETFVFFSLMLLIPSRLDWIMALMAGAVFVGAFLRFTQAVNQLKRDSPKLGS